MPVDTSEQTIEVVASSATVLKTLRDVESQAEWIPEIRAAEVLEVDSDGMPATAAFKAAAPVGTDEYTLAYTHRPDGMSWTMVKGRLQTGQEGDYSVRKLTPKRSSVTYRLTIHHNLPLPGFLRSRVIKGLVSSTLGGLKSRVEE
jgi:hypothetical protein